MSLEKPEKLTIDGVDRRMRQRCSSRRLLSGNHFASTSEENEEIIKTMTFLIHWNELPTWRRDNDYIHHAYRQTQHSYRHSIRSLFYLHNQSVNIWSHLNGAIGVVIYSLYLYYFIFPRYKTTSSSDVYVFTCFGGGASLCLGTSAIFHTVLDHSQEVARWGNKMDYTGIVALIVGSHVPALHYGFSSKPTVGASYLSTVSVCVKAGC